MEGEIVTTLQEKSPLPDAIGDLYKLPFSDKGEHVQWKLAEDIGYNPLEGTKRHSMNSVLYSIQDQQQRTREALNEILRKS